MTSTVVGLFDSRDHAVSAVNDLIKKGIDRNRVSVVAADPAGKLYREHVNDEGNIAPEGAASGLTSGAIVGGLLGVLIGAGLIFVPAGVLAAGPIAGLIAGGAAGAATGGILGGLIGVGIPKEHADVYAESVRRGGTLVMVQAAGNEVDVVREVLDRDGAVDIEERGAHYRSQGFAGYDANAPVYTEEQVVTERAQYRDHGAAAAVPTNPIAGMPRTPEPPIAPAPVVPPQVTGSSIIGTGDVVGSNPNDTQRLPSRIRTYSAGSAYADSPNRVNPTSEQVTDETARRGE